MTTFSLVVRILVMGSYVHAQSKLFASKIIDLSQFLCTEKSECDLSKQILQSGTKLSKNISIAQTAETKDDFAFNLKAGLKQAKETNELLNRLFKNKYLTESEYQSLSSECSEIQTIISAILGVLD